MGQYLYEVKGPFITPVEIQYLKVIKNLLPKGYYVQSQINLASVIVKKDTAKYHSELFRNVDAGVFDANHHPIFLIEINDSSHKSRQRSERDIKVKNICEEAGLPLVVLWTSYDVNEDYIKRKLELAFEESKNPVRVKHSYYGESKTKNIADLTQYIDEVKDESIQQNKKDILRIVFSVALTICIALFCSVSGYVGYRQTSSKDMIYGSTFLVLITLAIGITKIIKYIKKQNKQ